MKRTFSIIAGIFILLITNNLYSKPVDKPQKISNDFYELKFISIAGKTIDFNTFKGKKVLIVNTASECRYTPQFEGLEQLSKKYKDNLVVIGFPSNEFGSQEPGENSEILEFCQTNYGVTFLMMDKSSVKGSGKNPVYLWLTDKKFNGWNEQEPDWNFCKYLIDEKGKLIEYFNSKVEPMSDEIISKVNK